MVKTALAIKSCHKYVDRRNAQLSTWLKNVDTEFFFLLGKPLPDPDALECLPDTIYCDTSDSFADIAPKIVCAVSYALEENVTNLCVCDDDTYIHWARMLKSGFEKFDYLGFVRNYGPVPYMQGSCYWLSERAMELIVMRKGNMHDGIPDDQAVGHCLNKLVPFTHEHRFAVSSPYPERYEWPREENDTIAVHKMTETQMRLCHSLWSK